MISVEEIRKKAEHKFIPYLHSLLAGDTTFFPLNIPAAKGSATDNFSLRKTEADNLYHYSKNKKGSGYTVVTNTIKTRSKGMQTVIEKILFETEVDFLRFIHKETAADNFKTNLESIKTQCRKFNTANMWYDWSIQHCFLLTDVFEAQYWEQLFLCADWFLHNSPCGLYLREIPLPVHTKFIEQNRTLIFSLYYTLKNRVTVDPIAASPITAESASPALKNTAEAIYAEWGVRTAPPFIRFRLLDTTTSVTIAGETLKTGEVQIPLESFAMLRFDSVTTVFIIENLLVYLTFPAVPNSLCIFGSGFAAVQLQHNTHLQHKQLYYFGDIDEHGFEILSDFRTIFPDVISFCMDSTTYQTFSQFAVPGKFGKRDITDLHLTTEELQLFCFLQEHPECNRLEQERILQEFIQEQLVRSCLAPLR